MGLILDVSDNPGTEVPGYFHCVPIGTRLMLQANGCQLSENLIQSAVMRHINFGLGVIRIPGGDQVYIADLQADASRLRIFFRIRMDSRTPAQINPARKPYQIPCGPIFRVKAHT